MIRLLLFGGFVAGALAGCHSAPELESAAALIPSAPCDPATLPAPESTADAVPSALPVSPLPHGAAAPGHVCPLPRHASPLHGHVLPHRVPVDAGPARPSIARGPVTPGHAPPFSPAQPAE